MNRHEHETDWDDELGGLIRWSLRAQAAAGPSRETWLRLEQRTRALDQGRRLRRGWRWWLSHIGQVLNEHTLGSEAMWSPSLSGGARGAGVLRYRMPAAWLVLWPLYGPALPIV